jgi:hypothetical protein
VHPAFIVVAIVAVVALVGGAVAFAAFGGDDDADRSQPAAAVTTTTGPAPGTTTDPDDPLGDLGNLGDLGGLLGGDAAQLAQCFLGDVGGLIGGDRLQLPDDSATAQYDAVVEWVQQDRELTFKKVPTPVFVDAAEMARRVRAEIEKEFTPAQAAQDQQLLEALGAVAPGTDLRDEFATFVGGQVAGYYDPQSGDMVILGNADEPLDTLELTTVAHELEHALADQALGIPNRADTTRAVGTDEQLAATALVEGDATFTMTQFQLATLDLGALGDLLGGSDLDAQAQALQDAPHFIAAQLLFPYTAGLGFTCALRDNGGWDAVDAAYDKPPSTTAQVMFPDRYAHRETAQPVPENASPGDGWRQVRTQSFGAAELQFLFEAPGNDTSQALSDPKDRAGAWAGGTVTQWRRGSTTQVAIALRDRMTGDAPRLCGSMRAWASATDAAAPDWTRTVTCEGAFVRVAID